MPCWASKVLSWVSAICSASKGDGVSRNFRSIPPSRFRVDAQLRLVDAFDEEVDTVDAELHSRLKDHQGFHAIQAIPGVGPVIGATMVAEIGDVVRGSRARVTCARGPD